MIDELFLTSIGFFLFASLQALLMSTKAESRRPYLLFSSICLILSFYQGLVLAYFNATELEAMITLSRWQSTVTIFSNWLLITTMYYLLSYTARSIFLMGLFALSLVAIAINFYLPYCIRFGEVHGVQTFELLGQYGSTLDTSPTPHSYLLHLLGWSGILWIAYKYLTLSSEKRLHYRPFAFIFTIQIIAATIIGISIDIFNLAMLPIAGFLFIPLFCFISLNLGNLWQEAKQKLQATNRSLLREQAICKEHEERLGQLAQIFKQSSTATCVVAPNGYEVSSNKAFTTLFGQRPKGSFSLLTVLKFIHPDEDINPEALLPGSSLMLPMVASSQFPEVIRANLPTNLWLQFEVAVTRKAASEQLELIVIHCHDVTERYYSQQAFEYMVKGVSAKSGQSFFDGVVLNLAQLFNTEYAFIAKISADLTSASTISVCSGGKTEPNFTYELSGTPCANVLNSEACSYPSGVQDMFPLDMLLQEMKIEGYFGVPIQNQHQRKIALLVVLDTRPLAPSQFQRRIMEIFAARTGAEIQRREAEQETLRVAYEDYLTHLPNRAKVHQVLNQLLTNLPSYPCYFFMADIDQFKMINDALGHSIGDSLLQAIAACLVDGLPSELLVARIGGDEFVFISSSPESSPEEIAATIVKLMNAPISVSEHLIDISTSVGYTQIDHISATESQNDAMAVMKYAEQALGKAKKEGRSGYAKYEDSLELAAKNKIQIRSALKNALKSDDLQLYFQPQITPTGQCYGAEALLRWFDSERGFISPDIFIPIAEESGIIHQLGHWVNEKSCCYLKQWLNDDLFTGHLSINISAWQFALPNFTNDFINQLQQHDLPAHHICIELTESGLLSDVDDTISKLKALREAGIHIALDDFGTGYSSLAYLRDLPIDILKIDKAFINELERDESSPLVESMFSIGHNMKLKVVAEGVETEKQLNKLNQLNCDIYQGYYFAKPMSEEDFREWLSKNR